MATPLPLLEYAAPKAFFDRSYRYRSWSGLLALCVMSAFGGALIFGSTKFLTPGVVNGLHWWIAHGLRLCSGVLLLGAAVMLVQMLRGAERVVRVTEHGVTYGRTHWSWAQISRFGGKAYANGVVITFKLRGGHIQRELASTPMLTLEEFAELAHAIKQFALAAKMELLVVAKPEDASSD